MSAPEYCVYNETRANLLSARITVIDTRSDPLKTVKILIEGLAPNADTGLWLKPLKSVPTVPRLSAYDLVYLDKEGRVVHGIELVPDDEVPRFDGPSASALILPIHSFAASKAVPGDRVVLRQATDLPPATSALRALAPEPSAALVLPTPKALAPSSAPSPAPAPAQVENFPPLSWFPLPDSVAPAQPPAAQAARIQVASLQVPTPSAPAAQSRPAARPRFPLLRALLRLRVHIHISVTTAPSTPLPAEQTPAALPVHVSGPILNPPQARAQSSALPTLTQQFSQLGSAVVSAVRPPVARTASLLSTLGTVLSAAYLHWAEAFVFRPSGSSPSPVYHLPRIGRYIFDFIFPR
jgi:hypothetical protein